MTSNKTPLRDYNGEDLFNEIARRLGENGKQFLSIVKKFTAGEQEVLKQVVKNDELDEWMALKLVKSKLEIARLKEMHPPYLVKEIEKKSDEIANTIFYAVKTGSFTNFYITGPARSGKTTLIAQVAQRLINMSISVSTNITDDADVIVVYPGKQIPIEAMKMQKNKCYLVGCVSPPTSAEGEIVVIPKPSIGEVEALITSIAGQIEKRILRLISTKVMQAKSPIGSAIKAAKIIQMKGKADDETVWIVLAQCGIRGVSVYSEEEIRELLAKKVKGQNHIINDIAPLIADFSINHYSKPLTLLFTGPSGVGKTYMAKSIAELLDIPIFIESANTMKGEHDISRIIGAPPGYVGYAVKTPFIRFLNEHPSGGLVLFDEIDKATPNLLDVIMSFIETGRVVDNSGNECIVSNYIVAFTTNESMGTKLAGFEHTTKTKDKLPSLRKEFLSRLDYIGEFKRLKEEDVREVAKTLIEEMIATMKESYVDIDENIVWENINNVIRRYDHDLGVRPMISYIRTLRTKARRKL